MKRSTTIVKLMLFNCLFRSYEAGADHSAGQTFVSEPGFSSVGSRIVQEERRKPAVTTVVTAEEIESMGVTSLSEVLSRVAGIHVTRRSQHNSRIFYTRGIASELGSQTLFMINGIPVNSPIRGNFQVIWGGFPIHAVEQIEVMRGPGSSLYGANALSGVINIKMKDAASLESELGLTVGQNNTYNGWFSDVASFAGFEWFYNVEHHESDGVSPKVGRDFQTQLDEQFDEVFEAGGLPYNPEDLSLAPGQSDTTFKVSNVWVSGSNSVLDVNVGWQRRHNVGQGIGSLDALDPYGKLGAYRHFVQLTSKAMPITQNTRLSYDLAYVGEGQRVEGVLRLLPKGANLGAFPDGVLASPEFDESRVSGEFSIHHVVNQSIDAVLGVGRAHESIDNVNENKNFGEGLRPLPTGYTDVSGNENLVNLPKVDRDISYLFFESLVTVQDDIDITVGARLDDYSDFGSVTSPRASLVWMPNFSTTFKLTYGKAFRAPSFSDLHSMNNPVVNGNPALNPEKIDSIELSVEYLPTNRTKAKLTAFHYELKDFLELTMHPNMQSKLTTENLGHFEGDGVEFEYACDWNEAIDWQANITYVDVDNMDDTDKVSRMAGAPNWQSFIGLNHSLSDKTEISLMAEYIGERDYITDLGVARLDGFATWDAVLRYKTGSLKVELIGQNLNNAEGLIGTNVNRSRGSRDIMKIATMGRLASIRFTYDL